MLVTLALDRLLVVRMLDDHRLDRVERERFRSERRAQLFGQHAHIGDGARELFRRRPVELL
jgi:hypothetical protein